MKADYGKRESSEWGNLLFSYGVKEDHAADHSGHEFIGAGMDSEGEEVHVFKKKAKSKSKLRRSIKGRNCARLSVLILTGAASLRQSRSVLWTQMLPNCFPRPVGRVTGGCGTSREGQRTYFGQIS